MAGAELKSLADLSATQVKQLFEKLGIDTNSPFINAQMQGIYADTFYDEEDEGESWDEATACPYLHTNSPPPPPVVIDVTDPSAVKSSASAEDSWAEGETK